MISVCSQALNKGYNRYTLQKRAYGEDDRRPARLKSFASNEQSWTDGQECIGHRSQIPEAAPN
jgi:hypothetical protein